MSILINLLLAIFSVVSILLVFVILMQRPKSEGLGAAFGAAVTENIFGAQTTNVLTKITAWLAGIVFVLTFALSILYAHKGVGQTALRRELEKTQGATSASPSPAVPGVSPSPAAPNASVSPAATQPGPAASSAPDAGVGVLPAGSATPSTSQSPSVKASASPTREGP